MSEKDAVTVAWSIYQLAMRDELLPRFAKADMPPLPPPNPNAEPSPTPTPAVKPARKSSAKPE